MSVLGKRVMDEYGRFTKVSALPREKQAELAKNSKIATKEASKKAQENAMLARGVDPGMKKELDDMKAKNKELMAKLEESSKPAKKVTKKKTSKKVVKKTEPGVEETEEEETPVVNEEATEDELNELDPDSL